MSQEHALRTMWLAGVPADEIAAHLGVSRRTILILRKQYGIADRPNKYRGKSDPTPEEIRARKRECRRKHFAEKRCEPSDLTRQGR